MQVMKLIINKWALIFYPGVELSGREADHSRVPRAGVKNAGAIFPLPCMSSWPGAASITHRGNFIFTFLICVHVLVVNPSLNRRSIRKFYLCINCNAFNICTESSYSPVGYSM
jgi:hypothetical protein